MARIILLMKSLQYILSHLILLRLVVIIDSRRCQNGCSLLQFYLKICLSTVLTQILHANLPEPVTVAKEKGIIYVGVDHVPSPEFGMGGGGKLSTNQSEGEVAA